jgi:hypothetical protein
MRPTCTLAALALTGMLGASTLAAQITVQAGTGGSYSLWGPIAFEAPDTNRHYGAMAQICLDHELGIPAGSVISGLEYFKVTRAYTPAASMELEVYLRNTTRTEYSTGSATDQRVSDLKSAATLVYSTSTFHIPADMDWIQFGPFNGAPFVYQGGHLEVLILWNSSALATSGVSAGDKDGYLWITANWVPNSPRYISTSSTFALSANSNLRAVQEMNVGTPRPYYNGATPRFRVDLPAGLRLDLQPNFASATELGDSNTLVGRLIATAAGTAQTLNALQVEYRGTLNSAYVQGVRLWRDVDGDGLLSAPDVPLTANVPFGAGGAATLGAGGILTILPGVPVGLLVTFDTLPGAFSGESLAFRVTGSALAGGSGPDHTRYPLQPPPAMVASFLNSLPWEFGFEEPLPEFASARAFQPDEAVPMSPRILGGEVQHGFTRGGSPCVIASLQAAGRLTPRTGDYFLTAGYPGYMGQYGWDGVAALDVRLNLDALRVSSDQVVLEFYVRDAAQIGHFIPPLHFRRVFVSVDGGRTFPVAASEVSERPPEKILWDTASGPTAYTRMRVDIGGALQSAGLEYSRRVVIRIQLQPDRGTRPTLAIDDVRVFVAAPELELTIPWQNHGVFQNPFMPGALNQVLWELEAGAWGGNLRWDFLELEKVGNVPDSELLNLSMWLDDGDNVFDPGADQLLAVSPGGFSGGLARLSATPLLNLSRGQVVRLYVTASLAPQALGGETLGVRIAGNTSLGLGGGASAAGLFPLKSRPRRVFRPAASLPFHVNWEDPLAPANVTFQSDPGDYPRAAGTAQTPSTMATGARVRIYRVSDYQGAVTHFGDHHLFMQGPSTSGQLSVAAAAADFHFDLSAYSAGIQRVELAVRVTGRFWHEDGYSFVFLSSDGGATWFTAAFDLNSLLYGASPECEHKFFTVDLSQAFVAAGRSFTSNVVVRIQSRAGNFAVSGQGYRWNLSINEVRVTAYPDHVEVRPADPYLQYAALKPGVTRQVVCAFDLVSHIASHTVMDVLLRRVGTLDDSSIERVDLWLDFPPNGFFDGAQGDQLLSPGGPPRQFQNGVVGFQSLNLSLIPSLPTRLFVTVDLSASAAPDATFAIRLDTDVVTLGTQGAVVGELPFVAPLRPVLKRVSALPWDTTFVADLPPSNMTLFATPGVFPVAQAPGLAVSSEMSEARGLVFRPDFARPNTESLQAEYQDSKYHEVLFVHERALRGTCYGLPVAPDYPVVAYEFHFDLAGVNVNRRAALFEFEWWSEGGQDDAMGVFLSTDSGQTWSALAHRFGPLTLNYLAPMSWKVWTKERFDLSQFARNNAIALTDQVVLRIQSCRLMNYGFMLDNVSMYQSRTIGVDYQGSPVPLASNSSVGAVPVGVPLRLGYEVVNRGQLPLTMLANAVQISGVANCQVTLLSSLAGTRIEGGSSVPLEFEVTAAGSGFFSFLVQLASDDNLTNPFTFTVSGNAGGPRLALENPLGSAAPHGSIVSLAVVPAVVQIQEWRAANTGDAILHFSGPEPVTVGSLVNCGARVLRQPDLSLSPSQSTTFELELSPGMGPFSFELYVASNATALPVHTVAVEGVGVAAPRLEVRDSAGVPIVPDGFALVGNLVSGGTGSVSLSLHNAGTADLQLAAGVSIIYALHCDATITSQPSAVIVPGTAEPLSLRVAPRGAGELSIRLRVQSNDPSAPDYQFTLEGSALSPRAGAAGTGCAVAPTLHRSLHALWLMALAAALFATRHGRRKARSP